MTDPKTVKETVQKIVDWVRAHPDQDILDALDLSFLDEQLRSEHEQY